MPRKSWSRLKRRPRMYVPTAGCARLCCVCGTGPVRITGRCLLQYLGQGTGKRRYVSGTSGCRPPRCPLRTPRCRSGTRHCTGREGRSRSAAGGRPLYASRVPGAPLGARLRSAHGYTAPPRTAPPRAAGPGSAPPAPPRAQTRPASLRRPRGAAVPGLPRAAPLLTSPPHLPPRDVIGPLKGAGPRAATCSTARPARRAHGRAELPGSGEEEDPMPAAAGGRGGGSRPGPAAGAGPGTGPAGESETAGCPLASLGRSLRAARSFLPVSGSLSGCTRCAPHLPALRSPPRAPRRARAAGCGRGGRSLGKSAA